MELRLRVFCQHYRAQQEDLSRRGYKAELIEVVDQPAVDRRRIGARA
ncbi:MAG TPA: hypothetical protein VFY29_03950 [Terriglobia bacterium]|nr:hypothetical protein [Terriglobia bacterium]